MLSSTSPSSSPPREKRRYAPLKPSPLNPNTYYFDSARHGGSAGRTKPTRRSKLHQPHPARFPQRYAVLLSESPTQRLLRQKALAAWRHHHVSSMPASAASVGRSQRGAHSSVPPAGTYKSSNGPAQERPPHGGARAAEICPDERKDDDDGGEGGVGLLTVNAAGQREGILCISCPDLEREGGEGERVTGAIRKRGRYPGRAVDASGIAVRRVFAVVAVFIGLGLVHGLVTAFGGAAVGGRPPAAGD
ncbi:uncharacterized protein B0T15DRAFT_183822 [Chaetomium strumarium]|uniref:Uncharacterized protein n=1 Tax=Chaetomium strumarium TaxID=1170767 RepID=A0AAJ0GWY4_9PEZI|nr:hypothetical protein B0T15DRAFT_183822 [Chaetomium strumarium]